MKNKFRAQGTIEYLVIIAVVVVIALVVVSLLTGFVQNSGNVSSNAQKVQYASNVISVNDIYQKPDGNYVISLTNLSNNEIEIIEINMGGYPATFDEIKDKTNRIYFSSNNEERISFSSANTLSLGEEAIFYVSGVSGCTPGTTISGELELTYRIIEFGIDKKISYGIASGICQDISVVNPIISTEENEEEEPQVDSVAPVVQLTSPINGDIYEGTSTQLTFTVSDASDIENCSLYIDGSFDQNYTSIDTGTETITKTLSKGEHTWALYCTDEWGNSSELTDYEDMAVYATENLQYCKHEDWEEYTSYTYTGGNRETILLSGASGVNEDLPNNVFLNCFVFETGDDNIILNGSGSVITGNNENSGAFIAGAENIIIKNIEFSNFQNGVVLSNSPETTDVTLINVTASGNNEGIFALSNDHNISSVTLTNNSRDIFCPGTEQIDGGNNCKSSAGTTCGITFSEC